MPSLIETLYGILSLGALGLMALKLERMMTKLNDDFAALKAAADGIVAKLAEVSAALAAAQAANTANDSAALQAALDDADAKVLAITAELTPAPSAPPVAPTP